MPELTYAIGDIHGCLKHLRVLLDKIEEHRTGRSRKLVFLGDYIDRGPDSAGVIALLRELQEREPENVVCLMGNHEDLMLHAHYVPGLRLNWLMNGGNAVLRSFGIDAPEDLPSDVVRWVKDLPTVHEDSQRFFVHAGFRPGAPAPDPDAHARLWIREPFLSEEHDFGKYVIHGHTPVLLNGPDVRPYRTNLDTGCVYGAALTAGVFTDERGPAIQFLQVE
ncbi:metallophosphoesterase family protein [Methylobacterium soli]|uniref:Serine/threonine protein phosphatase n=1 Tax=Methylobacterium soli TaxID=553447 RepID=A0A6L3SZ04_9HYPH|nr:metallophosphoesterase family protein [Methylobacterium soli]KAB1079341.1 serine/threonine protein phosphatase [Methylobacterium soli]